jgi:predicted translin family RNA/ssDNA-binding protein
VDGLEGWALPASPQNLAGFSRSRKSVRSSMVGPILIPRACVNHIIVPVNLKDRDAFHITIEEYLQSLITLIEELARLAINSVTLGDYQRPLQISQFVKDLHAGFQILNLKNDSLRRRSDSIKYNVKKIEDIVYDLSLRNLVPKAGSAA